MHVFYLYCSNLANPHIQVILSQSNKLAFIHAFRIIDELIDELGAINCAADGLKVDCQLYVAVSAQKKLRKHYVCVSYGIVATCCAYWA